MQSDDVRYADFTIVKRGFDITEVQQFLGRVALEFDRLQSAALHAQSVSAPSTPAAPAPTPGGQLNQDIERIMRFARDTANQIVGDAKIQADSIVGQANEERARLMSEAQQLSIRAQHELDQARQQAAHVEFESSARARALVDDAMLRIEVLQGAESEARARVEALRDSLTITLGEPTAARESTPEYRAEVPFSPGVIDLTDQHPQPSIPMPHGAPVDNSQWSRALISNQQVVIR